MKKLGLLLCMGLSVLFFSCGEKKVNIEGKWEVEKIVSGNLKQTNDNVYVELKKKGLSEGSYDIFGCSGVNTFNGSIKIKGNKITVGNLAMTKMMGDPESQRFEDTFIQILTGTNNLKLNGNELIIENESLQAEIFLKK